MTPPAAPRDVMRSLAVAWLALCLALAGVAIGFRLLGAPFTLTHLFLLEQDLPAAVVAWLILAAAPWLAARARARPRAPSAPLVTALLSAAVLGIAYAGAVLIHGRYGLSMDEFMVGFDAAIYRTGRLAADVPLEWRPYVPALQPIFLLPAPENAWWVSSYLPVNAMLRAALGWVTDPALAGPIWAGLSVALTYGVGRRMRPERPALALTAAVLLAGSSQLLVTAMTPYAMSAHLALNLLWLWLILRGGLLGHGAAIPAAFAATGLHQLIFHPLFAAPFVLRLWLTRRWGPALAHTAAYAAIGLFWASYWSVALPTPPAASEVTGVGGWLERAWSLAAGFEPSGLGLMAANLLRLVVWQHPLLAPLLLLTGLAAWRTDETAKALWGGLLLTVLAMVVLLPYQGHGWGYRYLHGLLGSACLLAAAGWLRLVDGLGDEQRRRAWNAFAGVSAAAALILLPLHAWSANRFLHPYAAASRVIAAADADVVLVDDTGLLFGPDLARNDPFLRNRPKVMLLRSLRPEQLRALCAGRRVAVFDADAGSRLGIRATDRAPSPAVRARRAVLARPPCAAGEIR